MVIMPVVGILSLVLVPADKRLQVIVTTVGLIVIAAIAVRWSIRYSKNEAAMRLQANA